MVGDRQSVGVPASPSGYSAEPEPSSTVSAVPVSIPNASMLELADRCEQASRGNRDIDWHIFAALNPDKANVKQSQRYLYLETYTTSLDAAMTLVPDNSHVLLNGYNADNFWNRARVQPFRSDGETPPEARAASLPLALCAAALRAASAIEAATAGETAQTGSTEGESAAPQEDAQPQSSSKDSNHED